MKCNCIGYYYTEDNAIQLYWMLIYTRHCNTIELDITKDYTKDSATHLHQILLYKRHCNTIIGVDITKGYTKVVGRSGSSVESIGRRVVGSTPALAAT